LQVAFFLPFVRPIDQQTDRSQASAIATCLSPSRRPPPSPSATSLFKKAVDRRIDHLPLSLFRPLPFLRSCRFLSLLFWPTTVGQSIACGLPLSHFSGQRQSADRSPVAFLSLLFLANDSRNRSQAASSLLLGPSQVAIIATGLSPPFLCVAD